MKEKIPKQIIQKINTIITQDKNDSNGICTKCAKTNGSKWTRGCGNCGGNIIGLGKQSIWNSYKNGYCKWLDK